MSEHALHEPDLRDSNDVGWRSLFVGQGPQPPYVQLLGTTLAVAALAVAAALAIGATGEMRLAWIFLGGSWAARGQVTRWWAYRHGHRSLSWVPAAVFAAVAVAAGYIVAAVATTPDHRAFVIYFGLVVGWFGSDGWDWIRRRRQADPVKG